MGPASHVPPQQITPVNGYNESYTSHGGPVRDVMPQEEYAMRYTPDDSSVMHSRRFSFHSNDSPDGPMYEAPPNSGVFPSQSHSRSPTGYNTGASAPEYYLSYAPVPGAPQAYDSTPLSHAQGMPLVALPSPAMDPMGSGSAPIPAVRAGHYLAHEKSLPPNFGSHMGKPADCDLPRQGPLEYPASQPTHSIPGSQVQHQQPWPGPTEPNPGGELWSNEFKFYNTMPTN